MRKLRSLFCFILLLINGIVFSQDQLSITQINGNATPPGGPPAAVALANTCPNATYQLTVRLENTGGNLVGSSITVNVEVNGPNRANNGGAAGVDVVVNPLNIAAAATQDVVVILNLSNPGANSLNVTISGAAVAGEAGADLNNNSAIANITSNAIAASATLNSDVGSIICEGDLVTISSGGGSTYHFFINGAPLTAIPTSNSSFNTTSLADGDVVSVTVVDASGCITNNTLTFTVNQSPNSEGAGTLVDLNPKTAADGFVTTDLQKDRITISGSSAGANESYFVNINGTLIEYKTVGVVNNNTIASQLADKIDDLAFINTAIVSTVGATSEIEITGLNSGADYTMEVSSSVTANATIGVQRLQAAKTITICDTASIIQASGPGTVTGWAFTLNGAPPAFLGFAVVGAEATLTSPPNNSLLRVLGSNAAGCSSEKYVNIVVNEITSAGVIGSNQDICIGQEASTIQSLSVGTASSSDAVISYSWYFNNGAGWTEFAPMVTTENYQPEGLMLTTSFRRQTISTLNGMACTEDSNEITITVKNALNAGQARDNATTNTTVAICSGTNAALLEVNGGEGAALDIEFEWQKSINNADWTDEGVNTATYDPTENLLVNTYYRRVTRRISGGVPICEVFSLPVLIRINTINPGVIENNQTICDGDLAGVIESTSPALGAGGDGTITYQWQVWSGAAWGDVVGANLENYSPGVLAVGTHRYRRGARSTLLGVDCPSGSFEFSNEVIITVAAALVGGTAQTAGVVDVCSGGNAPPLTVAGGTAAGAGIEFLWQTSTDNVDWVDAGVTNEAWDPAGA